MRGSGSEVVGRLLIVPAVVVGLIGVAAPRSAENAFPHGAIASTDSSSRVYRNRAVSRVRRATPSRNSSTD